VRALALGSGENLHSARHEKLISFII
jgi:hypothetical protein